MSFILQNIEKKLKKSIISCTTILLHTEKNKQDYCLKKEKLNILFVIKKLFFNFLIFFSKNLRKKKNNVKNLVLFLKFYSYFNTFFFNNKLFFYKKYFLKENPNLFYFNKFFLSTKQIRLKPCLHRLKAKRIAFYKKFIWIKNKRFRKKNILIFNKKFFKFYSSNRFEPFIVDSLLFFFKINKYKHRRIFKKKFFGLLHKRYYYLFLQKRYILSIPRKKYYTKKILSFNFRHKTYAKIFVNRKFFSHRRRKVWRQVYYTRNKKRAWKRAFFFNFNTNSFNKLNLKRYKKNIGYHGLILYKYLSKYGAKLAKKHSYNKNFYDQFFERKRFRKRFKNVLYFFKWKPKKFNFCFSFFLKKDKNIKKILFGAIWFKFFYKKIFWKKKKNAKLFLLFYYINFFLNKNFLLFSPFLKAQFCFVKSRRLKKRWRLKKRRFTVYVKRIRKRIIKREIKKKFIKFFLILLFFKLMNKHKRSQKFFLFRNSFFFNTLKKIRLSLLSSVLLGKDSLYFKNNTFLNYDVSFYKRTLKTILLLDKKK